MNLKPLAIALALGLLSGCSAKTLQQARQVNSEHKLPEPNAMLEGPGLFTGKKGHVEVYSEEEEYVDPNKPKKVRRRRR